MRHTTVLRDGSRKQIEVHDEDAAVNARFANSMTHMFDSLLALGFSQDLVDHLSSAAAPLVFERACQVEDGEDLKDGED